MGPRRLCLRLWVRFRLKSSVGEGLAGYSGAPGERNRRFGDKETVGDGDGVAIGQSLGSSTWLKGPWAPAIGAVLRCMRAPWRLISWLSNLLCLELGCLGTGYAALGDACVVVDGVDGMADWSVACGLDRGSRGLVVHWCQTQPEAQHWP